jgi:DNA-binding MarR family transcriptional regulator
MSRVNSQDAADSLERVELFFLLGLGFQFVLGEFVRRLDAAGYEDLRPVHGLVFQALARGDTTSTELAERIGVTKQAAGQMVDYLEKQGYLERSDHPEGGRRRLVSLTDKAAMHMRVAARLLADFERELSDAVGDARMDSMRAALVDLIRLLTDEPAPPLRPVW